MNGHKFILKSVEYIIDLFLNNTCILSNSITISLNKASNFYSGYNYISKFYM